ncbi:hypothetical protein [Nocardia fluminea]|uniref:hypothetical protein n=1 Tax=Nocardia fluminea TaxID=134984 RepID=UPI0037AEA35D
MAVESLANALRDQQLDGALLGAQVAVPCPDGRLHLDVHPTMAFAVLHHLLPYFDPGYGDIRGVVGLRPRRVNATAVELTDVSSSAGLTLNLPEPIRIEPVTSAEGAGYTAVWHQSPGELHPAEIRSTKRPGAGNNPMRDRVFSRLLRRPLVLQQIGSAHGYVNTYTHGSRDLVIEWCCGPTKPEAIKLFQRSGFGADVLSQQPSERGGAPFWWENTGLILRHLDSCYKIEGWQNELVAKYTSELESQNHYPEPPRFRALHARSAVAT